MRRDRATQSFKLQLLAVVLALVLLWYSLNPAPGPVIRKKREAEPPDEKKRAVEPRSMPATLPFVFWPKGEVAEHLLLSEEDVDDFEWPEYIDG